MQCMPPPGVGPRRDGISSHADRLRQMVSRRHPSPTWAMRRERHPPGCVSPALSARKIGAWRRLGEIARRARISRSPASLLWPLRLLSWPDEQHPLRRCYRRPRAAPRTARPAAPPDGQRVARACDGRGRKGQFRPSRHADGHGRHRRPCCSRRFLQIRPAGAGLARPRPLRAVDRARLDAALRALAPARLSRHDARRDEALPPARQPHRRPSRARPRHRHRDDDRAARPGARQFGRHGAGRAACSRPNSATTSSTTTPM